MAGYTRQAGLGPWTQLGDQVRRLQILMPWDSTSRCSPRSRGCATTWPPCPPLRPARNGQPVQRPRDPPRHRPIAPPGAWNGGRTRSTSAPSSWPPSSARRSETEIARTRFNDYGPLLRLGRIDQARALLLDCRDVFEDAHDTAELGKVLTALADVEDAARPRRGRHRPGTRRPALQVPRRRRRRHRGQPPQPRQLPAPAAANRARPWPTTSPPRCSARSPA